MAIDECVVHAGPRLGSALMASPQGHSGKTIVTLGLSRLLKHRGFSIQPFKKGPDYIDPSWLAVAAGRSCRNLDSFLIPIDRLITCFQQSTEDVDLALVEGAMGLYDGLESERNGTTAGLARVLGIPVVLIVNTARMTRSIAALVSGYQHFEPETPIAGVILNCVSGPRHEGKLRDAIERYCRIPVVASIPRRESFRMAERHLGLVPSKESRESESLVEQVARDMEPYVDLEEFLRIAGTFRNTLEKKSEVGPSEEKRVRIGVIHDQVFNFYYPENLEALCRKGVELICFDSIKDRMPEVDGLLIGGGFPEFHLERLEENRGLRGDILTAVERGLPVYAECAGLMYLCRKVHWQGRSYDMVGVVPGEVQLSSKPQGHGYVIAEVVKENPLFPVGLTVRGHELHHSSLFRVDGLRCAYRIRRGHGIDGEWDGFFYKNLFASYLHLHALGTPEWADLFVKLALDRKATFHGDVRLS